MLDGTPPHMSSPVASKEDLWSMLQERFHFPQLNSTQLYLFPGSVKHLHPEFDAVLDILLRTDQNTVVVVSVPRTGRDFLPTTHVAARHDLMHPTNPPAAVAKLKQRLAVTLGDSAKRVYILPPLDERIYNSLLQNIVAVLDPYPVGMHTPIIDAMMAGVPVVSAPVLQECTNSHSFGIAKALGVIGPGGRPEWPSNAEEYAVLALRLQGDRALRRAFTPAKRAAVKQGSKDAPGGDLETIVQLLERLV